MLLDTKDKIQSSLEMLEYREQTDKYATQWHGKSWRLK